MPTYIALLRAVNVGGTGKLPMTELTAMCERIGCRVDNNTVVALWARGCELPALPGSLSRLTNLRELNLSGNAISYLPPALGQTNVPWE